MGKHFLNGHCVESEKVEGPRMPSAVRRNGGQENGANLGMILGHTENKIGRMSFLKYYFKKYLFKYTCTYGNAFNDSQKRNCI